MRYQIFLFVLFVWSAESLSETQAAVENQWRLETFTIDSTELAENKVNLKLSRKTLVWLPPSYRSGNKRYPVIHYLHNSGWSNTQLAEVDKLHEMFERAHNKGAIGEFIFVAGDFTTGEGIGTFFGNNSVAGKWHDHIINELVPEIDRRYRTLAKPEARGLSGDFFGGYGALRIGMSYPKVFSSVYAFHPVGTDIGERLMRQAPNWQALNTLQTPQDLLSADGAVRAFMQMAQAFSPNLDKPPFYVDLMVEEKAGELVINAENTTKLHEQFLLSKLVPSHIDKLRKLKGIGFDWGRYDSNPDHVYANQKFTRVLDEYGIEHQAEEYRGDAWSGKWGPHGRAENDMLPFFQRYLSFN